MNKLVELCKDNKIIAHRGCWDNTNPENSYEAIKVAVEKGYAVELDIHMTLDKRMIVFHDHRLYRMCGEKGIVEDMTSADLTKFQLKNTEHTIPLLTDILQLIKGKSLLFIELKPRNNVIEMCKLLHNELTDYKGDIVIIGFDPIGIKYMKELGYTVALSMKFPKLAKDFNPDGSLCLHRTIPQNDNKRNKYPPFIAWTINSEKAKNRLDDKCIALIYNTKNFNHKL